METVCTNKGGMVAFEWQWTDLVLTSFGIQFNFESHVN